MAVNDIVMSAAGASGPATFVEDVFSCFLYTGNGSTQTITNGIDLSGKGGLVWMKERSTTGSHELVDTARGAGFELQTNNTSVSSAKATGLTAFTSSGFSLGTDSGYNGSGITFASWTFREQPKFFDIVTWTGDGTSNRLISHNLSSVPGCVIVKCTSTARSWVVAARADDSTYRYLLLNGTDSQVGSNAISTYATSTTFNLTAFTNAGRPLDDVNGSGKTYVAYLFAHNAGGFGLTGTDNVISCGSFDVVNGVSTEVNLGYEPQFVLIKRIDGVGDWRITDNMRGFMASTRGPLLSPNTSNAEVAGDSPLYITSTGFKTITTSATLTYIYIAIRRTMKTPTTGTEVFYAGTGNGSATIPAFVTNFTVDMGINRLYRTSATDNYCISRLTGSQYTRTNLNNAENGPETDFVWDSNIGYVKGNFGGAGGYTQAFAWAFKRAAGFFDEVCYTGTGSATTVTHNLGVVPELMIIKWRDGIQNWYVYSQPVGNQRTLSLNSTSEQSSTSVGYWNNTTPTASVFSVGAGPNVLSRTYVAYLFASCPGVSKVGSYTGTGATLNIDAGFTTGARFVMIKRTDATGDWFVWDTARGMVAGTDPRLALNAATAESNADWVYTASSGFQIVTTDATVNASGGTYIYLAIA